MAMRKSEWSALIKPIIDREGAKNDAKALARELSDVLDIKVNTDTEGLEQLIKEFNQHLEKMGKQQIVFSDKTLQGIVSQFANAVVEGMTSGVAAAGNIDVGQIGDKIGDVISKGIKDGVADAGRSVMDQINALQRRQHELHEQSRKLDKRYTRYENLAEISSLDYDDFKPLSLSGDEDIDEYAHKLMGEFDEAEAALNAATRGTKEYNNALIKAMQSASNLYRMSHTLNKNKNKVKDRSLFSDYSPESLSQITADVFEVADVDLEKIFASFAKSYEKQRKAIKAELAEIEIQIKSLQQQNIEVVNEDKAKKGLKTLQDIEAAYDRISKKGERAKRVKDGILSALSYDAGAESLTTLRNNYTKSLTSGTDWEKQYQWLVKFVKEYEATVAQADAETDLNKRKAIKQKLGRHSALYDELKPLAANAEVALRAVVDMGGEQSPSLNQVNTGVATEDVANAEKLVELSEQRSVANEAAADAAEREKAAIKDIFAIQKSLDKERFAYVNVGEGQISPYTEGGYEGVTNKTQQELLESIGGTWDSTIHTHPELLAAPSEGDIQSFVKRYDEFKRNFILARNQLAEIDFSELTQDQAQQISQAYKENVALVDDELMERLSDTPIKELGVEALDVDSILSDASKQLIEQFPNLTSDINTYLEKLRLTLQQSNITDLSQRDIEESISDLTYESFKSSDQDTESDKFQLKHTRSNIYQITKDLIDGATKIPSMYQEELQKIFVQTIGSLNLDPSKIFKLYDPGDFFEKLRQGALATNSAVEPVNGTINDKALAEAREEAQRLKEENEWLQSERDAAVAGENKAYARAWEAEQSLRDLQDHYAGKTIVDDNMDNNIPDNVDELIALRTQLEDEKQMRINTENALSQSISDEWVAKQRAKDAEAEVAKLQQELLNIQKVSKDTSVDTNTETSQINILKEAVEGVTAAVNDKTNAFKNEQEVVSNIATEEVNALTPLKNTLEVIRDLTDNIKANNDIGDGLNNVAINVNYQKDDKNTNKLQDINTHYLTNKDGTPLILYRGVSDVYGGLQSSRDSGTFSTPDLELAMLYAQRFGEGRIESVKTTMENPFEIDTHGAEWDDILFLGHGENELSEILTTSLAEWKSAFKYLEQITDEFGFGVSKANDPASIIPYDDPSGQYKYIHAISGQYFKDEADVQKQLPRLAGYFLHDLKNGGTSWMDDDDLRANDMYDQVQAILAAQNKYEATNATFENLLKQNQNNPYGYGRYDTNELANWAKSQGHDGVIFKNIYDGLDRVSDIFVTFARDQLHYIETFTQSEAEDLMIEQNQMLANKEFAQVENEFGANARQYANFTEDEIGNAIDTFVRMSQEFQSLIDNGLIDWNKEELESSYLQLKDKYINSDPALSALFNDHFAPSPDLPDDYIHLPDIFGSNGINRVYDKITDLFTSLQERTNKIRNKFGVSDFTLENQFEYGAEKPVDLIDEDSNVAEKTGQPWALESTLQTIRGVLDNIQTNTANIGKLGIANVDTITGTALDGRLTEIKAVLESIDNKIAKGGVIATRGAVKQANSQPIEPDVRTQATRSNMMKSLINDYKTMGKLSAQFASDGNLETKAMLENLKKEIARKRQSLQLTMEENANLREKYSLAFDAEERLLLAKKAQEKIDEDNKDAEKIWKKQVKDAQRATGINAATSAANAGDQTVLRAIGTEEISKDIEQKAKELSNQIKTLRILRDDIDQKGEKASTEDRDNLSKQISKVKELKNEVDGYLKIHEKYSGEGATQFNDVDTSNFGAIGTDQYWNNITAAIKNASTGRVAIKGMNADTGELTGTTKIAANTFATWSATVDPITGKLSMLRTGIKKTETIIEQITRKTKEIFTYFSGSSIIFKAFNELKKGVQYVREIDLALTELKKVTDETEETYDKFLETAAKTGARLGATISAVTEATATFAKLGYSMEQASEMAEAAIVYKNVGDNIASTEDAADSIISTLKGFGLKASESMAIVDKFNEVGNRFAITSQGIGEALRLSASALNEGGNSLDESIAIITAANEVVNDPSSVGTALKTLTLRLRGAKTELEEAGLDVENMATTTSQLQAKLLALTGGQVDIMLDENTFKNSTQILREMAAAWEDMNDIQRASALELMGGKRQANVLSALIQNFDTVEEAIEASAGSAGSALKENERYLNSIQGKIDQFINATQSMWSNFLDSDVIKFIVDLATKLIQLIDKIGMIPSVLGGVFIYLTAFKKQNPLEWIQNITQYLHAFKGTDGLKQFLGQLLGIAPAMKIVTAETVANTVATQMNDAATAKDMMSKMGLATATGSLSIAQKEQAANALFNAFTQGQLTQVQANAMLATLGYKVSLDGATWSLKTLDAATKSFMATNPIGWILAVISVVTVLATLISKIPTDVERLEEKISDLNSEISDLKSDIDSLNTELETTQDRMAELLAMPSLSFVEQEELKNLQLQNAELEKQIKLQEMLLTSKLNERKQASKEWIQGVWNGDAFDQKYWVSGNGTIGEDKWYTSGVSGKEALETSLPKYDTLRKDVENLEDVYFAAQKELDDNNKLSYETFKSVAEAIPSLGEDASSESYYNQSFRYSDKELVDMFKKDVVDSKNSTIDDMESGIELILGDMSKIIEENDLSYSMGDADINKFLDEYFAYQYAYQEAQGIDSKSSAIASIFDDTSSESIKNLKENLSEIASDDSLDAAKKQAKALTMVNEAINSTTGDYDRLKTSMDVIGITADEVARYFTRLSEAPDSSTVEGITAQYQKGVDALGKYKGVASDVIAEFINLDGEIEQITWGSLFDDEGEAIDTQISKVLQGADETARTEFARIAEAVNEGKMSVDNAMKSFSVSGVQAGYKLLENAVVEINSDIFKDLGDEISGLIDTFSEFGSALESVANSIKLVNQAQAEMAYSGHVSVETALDLINSTEDWNQVLKVENGNITLVDGAMNILAQSKLNQIKTNLQLALSEAQAGLEQARLAESSGEVAKTLEESTTESVRQLAANMEYLSTLIGEFLSGNFLGAGSAAKTAKENSLKSTEYQKTSTTSSMSVADWEEKVANIEAKLGILEGVDTPGEFEDNYYSDKVSGGNGTEKEVEDDLFQKKMDYWENRIAANQAKYEQLQNEIDLLEAKGQKADASFYEEQIKLEQEREWLLGEQKKEALARLQAIEDAGDEGSEAWWEVANVLNDIEGELDDVTASIVDLQDAIGEIDTYKFEEYNNRLDDITSKLETIRNLIAPDGEEDWFDDEGNWTEEGVAVLGSYIQELEIYKRGLAETETELNKYNQAYSENTKAYYDALGIHSEQEYYDKVEELTDQQYQFAESISDTEQSVVDMYESSIDAVEEYTETLINGYNDYIDSVKEALDAERDLYDFKKNVQKQAKDIADIERRIMSLSGSTNAADIAERRRLEADLYGAREELDNTYYDHAKESQQNALDTEAEAYEENMTRFVEGLRTSLEEATVNMDEFLMGVTSMVMYNADTIFTKYEETNLPLTTELTNPWIQAKEAVGNYSGNALDLMNQWTKEGGFFAQFNASGTTNLSSPWSTGTNAANTFKNSVSTVMSNVVSNISSNVKTASAQLSTLYQQIQDTEKRAANANVSTGSSGGSGGGGTGGSTSAPTQYRVTATLDIGTEKFTATGIHTNEAQAKKNAEASISEQYYNYHRYAQGKNDDQIYSLWSRTKKNIKYHAKGTTGTPRDEWAITDEPRFGDELTMYATPEGTLSFMRTGSTVVPADITANLVEWGKLNPDMLNINGTPNINMISNAINKPELNITFDSLIKAENITEETLPAVKKLVTQELNRFTKELNYALKGKGAR